MIPASELSQSANFHLFKQGIEPSWEDPSNQHGGKWAFSISKNKRGPELNNFWLLTVL
jgi:translation initiation factor 4E